MLLRLGLTLSRFRGKASQPRPVETPVKLESFDADSGFTLVGANAVKSLDTTHKVEGTGCINLLGTSINQTTGVQKSYGTKNKSDLGTIVYYWDRASAASVQSLIMRLILGATTEDATDANEAQFMLGGRWIARNISEFTTLPASGTLQVSPRFSQITPFSGEGRFDALYHSAGGDTDIVLTFDDGYDTIISTVLPILQARGLLATHFAAPGLLGTTGKMVEADYATLYAAGWDLACDSYNDTAFTAAADVPAALADLNSVKAYLNTRGYTRAMNHLCWPNGLKSEALATAFSDAGYKLMRNTEPQSFFARFGIPRGVRCSVPSQGSTSSTTGAQLVARVTEAETRRTAHFFHFHDVKASPSAIGVTIDAFTTLADHLAAKRNAGLINILTVSQFWDKYKNATPP